MPRKPKWGDVPCSNCGAIFRKRTAKRHLCSTACRDAVRRTDGHVLTCEACNKSFTVHTAYYADGPKRRRFCSPACRQIGHRVLPTDDNIRAKFWENAEVKGPDDCWPWRLAPGKSGYGLLTLYKFKRTAHRVSYEIHNGPIPKLSGSHGGCVLHSCDNRLCVNPKHLSVGTQADNLADMYAKGRGRHPRRKVCP